MNWISFEMFDAARAIVLASFPPGLDETEKRRLLLQRFYPTLQDQP